MLINSAALVVRECKFMLPKEVLHSFAAHVTIFNHYQQRGQLAEVQHECLQDRNMVTVSFPSASLHYRALNTTFIWLIKCSKVQTFLNCRMQPIIQTAI